MEGRYNDSMERKNRCNWKQISIKNLSGVGVVTILIFAGIYLNKISFLMQFSDINIQCVLSES